MRVGSIFSGIGGLDLGLERAGLRIVWQSEIDPYASAVLRKHWPNVPNLGDIRGIEVHHAEPVDIICGGFPCQPFSLAGKRRGTEDDRYLWPEMRRVIEEFQPRWVLGENVPGIINMALDEVLSSLEAIGYETGTVVVPACALNAPHRRDRVWILGHAKRLGLPGQEPENRRSSMADPDSKGLPEREREQAEERPYSEPTGSGLQPLQKQRDTTACWDAEPDVGRVAHGVPNRVDRLRSLGNAVVPQVAEAIGRMILAVDSLIKASEEETMTETPTAARWCAHGCSKEAEA